MFVCVFQIMPPRIVVQGRPVGMDVELQEQWIPNVPEVKPQREVTNIEFCEVI